MNRDARSGNAWMRPLGSSRVGEPPIGPFGVASILASVAFLLAGLAWPQAAGALLRIFLATLGAGFVVARAYEAVLPERSAHDFSPFDSFATLRGPPAEPLVVRGLAHELSAANNARRAARTPIPWSVRRSVRAEAARRLSENHGLLLCDAAHEQAIRSLLSEATWRLIDVPDDERDAPVRRTPMRGRDRRAASTASLTVPLSRLRHILDEVERL